MNESETRTDILRQIDKTLDVLTKVEKSMMAEAEMNATKHLADTVRPVPLAGAVSSCIGDLTAWRDRINADEDSYQDHLSRPEPEN